LQDALFFFVLGAFLTHASILNESRNSANASADAYCRVIGMELASLVTPTL